MTGYAERVGATHIDGTPIFQTAEDRRNESDVAAEVARAWACELRPFGMLAAVDWYAVRDGRPVGVLELKSRSHAHDHFATVFLNVRKWLALLISGVGLGVPAIYVVRFTDGLWWIRAADVHASRLRIGGTAVRVKSDSDIEPVIEVPVAEMAALTQEN